MRRYEILKDMMDVVDDELVVCNIGHPAQELYSLRDRDENFYMLGSMGLASSIGLGLALSSEKKVISIEGDGAILMNLGTLATIGKNRPKNYVLVIIDNEAYGSTGFQKTFTGDNVKLEQVALACGIENTIMIHDARDFKKQFVEVLSKANGPYCIVCKTEVGMPEGIKVIPTDPVDIKNRFIKKVNLGS